ncbi:unnamed protein product [Strongylus vulgaris]|uniref:Uncharacterized protein n=1 Tax=Strongylus vulgaris TaxID=40348 RepID=A0A3P7ILL8_STRVU|nr:unnamed protein product [Strongylus vulgaris]
MSRYRSDSSEETRGRSTARSTSDGLSAFYRERFGSHSPEEYMNLRISGFDDKLERDEIKEILTAEFRKFAPFEIKVVRNPGDDERLAYVNFERRDCARKVRYSIMDRLKKALGKRVLCDPAGILRDQEGKYIPDRFNRALQACFFSTSNDRVYSEFTHYSAYRFLNTTRAFLYVMLFLVIDH